MRDGRAALALPKPARLRLAALTSWVRTIPGASLYVIGSATTGEACWAIDGARSDVDFLLVTDDPPSPEFVAGVHARVREDGPGPEFGVRVRAQAELDHFSRRMTSWGYDLGTDAVWLSGPERDLPRSASAVPFGWVLNNWLERLWLNVRKAVLADGPLPDRFWAAFALDALMLDQMRRGIVHFRHRDRVREATGDALERLFTLKTTQGATLQSGDVEWAKLYAFTCLLHALRDVRRGRDLDDFDETSFGRYPRFRTHLQFLLAMNRPLYNASRRSRLWTAYRALTRLEREHLGSSGAAPHEANETARRYAALRTAVEPLTERDHGWMFRKEIRSDSTVMPRARANAVDAK